VSINACIADAGPVADAVLAAIGSATASLPIDARRA
jgi:hypothetical protein